MARVKEFGTPFARLQDAADTVSVLICGGCGEEVETLTSYGKKWLCDTCYAGKFAIKAKVRVQ